MAGAWPRSPGGRRRLRDDGVRTHTSCEQSKVEDVVQEVFDAYKTNHHAAQLVLQREKHFHYLKRGLRQLSEAYECLDASRPWLCYWILHSLELLEEPIPDAVASDVCQFLSRCQSPHGGFGGGPGQHPHLAPTYAAVNALCIIGTEEAFGVIDRKKLLEYLQALKQPDGSFLMHIGGEVDVRWVSAPQRVSAPFPLPNAVRGEPRGAPPGAVGTGRAPPAAPSPLFPQERLLRRRGGVAHQHPHPCALRRDGRVDREVPELGGRHRWGAGHGSPRRVHLLRRGGAGYPEEGAAAEPAQLAALGDQPADALRGRLPGPLQQAGGRLLLLLAGRAAAPAAPRAARAGRRGARHDALDVRPGGAAGVHPPVLPVPGRRAARQAGKVPGFLPHLLLPERAGHRPALRQRQPPPGGGPGRPRKPPAAHAPRLQHPPGEGGEGGAALLAAARARPGGGGVRAPLLSDGAAEQSEVLRVLARPKTKKKSCRRPPGGS